MTADELRVAVEDKVDTIELGDDIALGESIIVNNDLKICGAGWSITARVPQTETPSLLFQVEKGVTLDLVSLTVGRTNGAVPFEDGSDWPGCIKTSKDSTLLTTDTHFINCTAASEDGGAILADQAERVEIVNSSFRHVAALYSKKDEMAHGGAIAFLGDGALIVRGTCFDDSSAGQGGAIFMDGDQSSLAINGSHFNGCKASVDQKGWGGAVYANSTRVEVVLSSFSACEAKQGGSIYMPDRKYVPGEASLLLDKVHAFANVDHATRNLFRARNLTSFTMSNCVLEHNDIKGDGLVNLGRIKDLTVRDSIFAGNHDRVFRIFSPYRGGEYVVTRSDFVNNTLNEVSKATAEHGMWQEIWGGTAIYFKESRDTTLLISHCNFVNNRNLFNGYECTRGDKLVDNGKYLVKGATDEKVGCRGGALYMSSNAIIDHCVFEGNHAPEGGAIYLDVGVTNFSIRHSHFVGNVANDGGALSACGTHDQYMFEGGLHAAYSRFTGNVAQKSDGYKSGGGALAMYGGRVDTHDVDSWNNTPSDARLMFATGFFFDSHATETKKPVIHLIESADAYMFCGDWDVDGADHANILSQDLDGMKSHVAEGGLLINMSSLGFTAAHSFGDECSPCLPGSEWDPETLTCNACRPGWKKALRDDRCTECPVGRFQPNRASIKCLTCDPGCYANATGSTTCKPCNPEGTELHKCSEREAATCYCCSNYYQDPEKLDIKKGRELCGNQPVSGIRGEEDFCERCSNEMTCSIPDAEPEQNLWELRLKDRHWRVAEYSTQIRRCPFGAHACKSVANRTQPSASDVTTSGAQRRLQDSPTATDDEFLGEPDAGESLCQEGHKGPLCSVCEKKFYRTPTRCKRCEPIKKSFWAFALLSVVLFLGAILLPFVVDIEGTAKAAREGSLTDKFKDQCTNTEARIDKAIADSGTIKAKLQSVQSGDWGALLGDDWKDKWCYAPINYVKEIFGSLGLVVQIPWVTQSGLPYPFNHLVAFFELITAVNFLPDELECYVESFGYHYDFMLRLQIVTLAPIALILLLCVLAFVMLLCRPCLLRVLEKYEWFQDKLASLGLTQTKESPNSTGNGEPDSKKNALSIGPWRTAKLMLFQAVMVVVYFAYTCVTNNIFRAFRECDKFEDRIKFAGQVSRRWMKDDYQIACNSDKYANIQVYAGVMMAIYCIGIPLLLLLYIWHFHRGHLIVEKVELENARTLVAVKQSNVRSLEMKRGGCRLLIEDQEKTEFDPVSEGRGAPPYTLDELNALFDKRDAAEEFAAEAEADPLKKAKARAPRAAAEAEDVVCREARSKIDEAASQKINKWIDAVAASDKDPLDTLREQRAQAIKALSPDLQQKYLTLYYQRYVKCLRDEAVKLVKENEGAPYVEPKKLPFRAEPDAKRLEGYRLEASPGEKTDVHLWHKNLVGDQPPFLKGIDHLKEIFLLAFAMARAGIDIPGPCLPGDDVPEPDLKTAFTKLQNTILSLLEQERHKRDESKYARFLRKVGLGEKSEALNHGDSIIKAKEEIRRERFMKMRDSGIEKDVYDHASIACIAFVYRDFHPNLWAFFFVDYMAKFFLGGVAIVIDSGTALQSIVTFGVSLFLVAIYGFCEPKKTADENARKTVLLWVTLLTNFSALLDHLNFSNETSRGKRMLGWVLTFITMVTIVLEQSLEICTQLAPYIFSKEKSLTDMAQDKDKRNKLKDTLMETIKKIKDVLCKKRKTSRRIIPIPIATSRDAAVAQFLGDLVSKHIRSRARRPLGVGCVAAHSTSPADLPVGYDDVVGLLRTTTSPHTLRACIYAVGGPRCRG